MLRRDADHQTDPLVLLWDAVASGSASPATGDNPGAAGLITDHVGELTGWATAAG